MINIDFLAAGCNTRCQHCYVNGGPRAMMPFEDALSCIERLDHLAQYLSEEVSFTLDHEPMNHPQIAKILAAAAHTHYIQNYHHGMTTGIALMRRKDKDAVINAYLEHGYDTFGITIHGNATHHDEIVRHKGAYDAAIVAAEYLKSKGANIEVSLMLNRYFPEDADSITAMLTRLHPNHTGITIPIFTPHRNMMDFEAHRATLKTLNALQEHLRHWVQEKAELTNEKNTVTAVTEYLKQGTNLMDLFAQKQDELYLTLHQNRKLYVGNSGAETQCLGDLQKLNLEAVAEKIKALPKNRDYVAFYDTSVLPPTNELIDALQKLPGDMLYGDFESVIYRGLVALNVPTRILNI